MKAHFGCPIQATSNVFAGKWKVLIVWHLSFEPRRFGELRRLLRFVSEKVLTAQLRELESDGVLTRAIRGTTVPEVTYSLTPAGTDLIPAMEMLCAWGTKYLGVQPTMPPRPVDAASGTGADVAAKILYNPITHPQ